MRSHLLLTALFALAGCRSTEPDQTNPNTTKAGQPETSKPAAPTEKEEEEEKLCDDALLTDEEKQQWECVPVSGYWCTHPDGCTVRGNRAGLGTRLNSTFPLPKGEGYRLSPDAQLGFGERWHCDRKEGCLCGTEKIAQDAICYEGEIYDALDALSGPCNRETCGAFCHKGQCICGSETDEDGNAFDLPYAQFKDFVCHADLFLNFEGNHEERADRFQNQSFYTPYAQFYLKCEEGEGCQCGKEKCEEGHYCMYLSGESSCEDLEHLATRMEEEEETEEEADSDSEDAERSASPKGRPGRTFARRPYRNTPDVCMVPEGCKCGSQTCAQGQSCKNNFCVVYVSNNNNDYQCESKKGCNCGEQTCAKGEICKKEMYCFYRKNSSESLEEAFTCPRPQGCDCGSQACPKGAVCRKVVANDDSVQMACVKKGKALWREAYLSSHDLAEKQNYYLRDGDDRTPDPFVLCSTPGCDCGGVPLKAQYLCIEQHHVFDQDRSGELYSYKAYRSCHWPYEAYSKYPPASQAPCELAQNVIEQICADPQGCPCGSGRIPKGDLCIDERAQCSSQNPRPGCLCGDQKLEKNYGCFEGNPICASDRCLCGKKTIQRGDLCTQEGVLCGPGSTTPGCICGQKPLREGYRCLSGEQHCACKGKGECSCKCGEEQIPKNDVCTDADRHEAITDAPYSYEGELIVRDGHLLWQSNPEDRAFYETCGTGMPSPGKDYGCAFKASKLCSESEQSEAYELAGHLCLNFEGCKCGEETCEPGMLCERNKEGLETCEKPNPNLPKPNPFDGRCDDHVLPAALVGREGYGCYEGELNVGGWYCNRDEGCKCGDQTCDRWQICLIPGQCGRHPLLPEARSDLKEVKIDRVR